MFHLKVRWEAKFSFKEAISFKQQQFAVEQQASDRSKGAQNGTSKFHISHRFLLTFHWEFLSFQFGVTLKFINENSPCLNYIPPVVRMCVDHLSLSDSELTSISISVTCFYQNFLLLQSLTLKAFSVEAATFQESMSWRERSMKEISSTCQVKTRTSWPVYWKPFFATSASRCSLMIFTMK